MTSPAREEEMFDTCFLHIGLEKTGTTSIQHFLHDNRAELETKGFYHPHSLHSPNNTKLYMYGADEERINETHRVMRRGLSPDEHRAKIAEGFYEEVAKKSGILVLSNEHLHSEFRTIASIARIKDLLSPLARCTKVVAYIRRQDRVSVSQYSTALKGGMEFLPEVFKSLDEGIEYYFNYDKVLNNYAEVFGEKNIIARIFEPELLVGQDAVLDFAQVIGLNDFSWLRRPARTNESLRPVALRFLAEANKHIPVILNNTANPVRLQLITAIEQHYAGTGPVATREEARLFYSQFADANESLRLKRFPERAALFSDDFSMYPESTSEVELTFEDASQLAAIMLSSLVR